MGIKLKRLNHQARQGRCPAASSPWAPLSSLQRKPRTHGDSLWRKKINMHLTKCKRSTEQRQFIKRHPNVKYFCSSSCPVTIEVFSFFKCSTFGNCRDHNFKLNMPNKPWWVWLACCYYFCLAPILVPHPPPTPTPTLCRLETYLCWPFPSFGGGWFCCRPCTENVLSSTVTPTSAGACLVPLFPPSFAEYMFVCLLFTHSPL